MGDGRPFFGRPSPSGGVTDDRWPGISGVLSSRAVAEASPDAHPCLSTKVAGTLLGSKESWIRRMFELAGQLRADGGGPVYDLSLGNPSLEPPACWKQAIRDLVSEDTAGQHRYMTNAGFPEVRAFIAKREAERFALPIEAVDVTMTVGAAGAINVVMRAMLDPGEEVMVPAPYFAEYDHYCDNVGAVLRPVRTRDDFRLDLDAIRAAIGPKTRLLIINSPNNPTGAIYDAASLKALAELLDTINEGRARPVYVVEDSPYRDTCFDGSLPASMMSFFGNCLHATSHSKDLGLAGERIGYLVLSPRCEGRELLARGFGFCNRVLGFVNAPALMQRALPRVLGRPDGGVDIGIYAQNCRWMAARLSELGFVIPEPRAGFFLFPRLPEGSPDDVTLTDLLLEERTIVVPGAAFGVPNHLRLSMCVDFEVVERAYDGFRAVLSRA